jgi:3-oxoacyl-[acyl-carrier-protein] synthase II
MSERRKVVVTGLGLATSLGLDVEESWQKALGGVSGVRRITGPLDRTSPVQAAGEVSAADRQRIEEEFQAEAQSEGERKTLFALWAAKRALEDSSLLGNAAAPGGRDRYGVILASGLGINPLEDIQSWVGADRKFDFARFALEIEKVRRESILRNNSNRTAALISTRFGLRGINGTVTSACASGTQAVGIGYRAIQRGEADVIAVGGADSMINPVGLIFFVLLSAATTSSEPPETLCRPFDRKRSGLVMGEGAGVAILEEEFHASKRGARIYAEVAGYGASLDAYQVTAPHPQGRGAEQSMRAAFKDAGLGPDGIDYINAHGTSTKLNDLIETVAIKRVFGEHASRVAISSSKSLIGHLLAASGAPEFVFTVLTVARDEIHPTINLAHPDPKCDLDYVPNIKRKKTVRAALSNSFGFGGQNGSIIVRKYSGEGRCSST